MSYLTRGERSVYERRRREKVTRESRDFRIMQGWLTTTYPDVMAAFMAFKDSLRRESPWRKDLSTSPLFHRYVRGEAGTFRLVFFSLDGR